MTMTDPESLLFIWSPIRKIGFTVDHPINEFGGPEERFGFMKHRFTGFFRVFVEEWPLIQIED